MQNSVNLFDANGNYVQFGSKLGTGGEGDVFELSPDLVAKIYHQPLSIVKQKKLVAMAGAQTPALLNIATWPTKTLHSSKHGPVCGFIMPKLIGYKEIHKLYGPAHRKNEFPSADWAFLIQVARNTAAAIATIHQLGCVVGDINPGNIAVSSSALVKLIDCDSFQLNLSGELYTCEVGVAHFTPPELQGKSFSTVTRTPNHDNFGLALLCFHLLFMGRHPFAGKYKDGKEDMSIEKAIREFRFAYSTKAVTKSMAPPPNTLLLNVVSPDLAQLFELALDQNGVFAKRPTATQWVKALEDFKSNLITCPKFSTHKFYRSLSNCPWCTLESKTGVTFFLPPINIKRTPAIDLNRIWQDILNITSPGTLNLPNFSFNLQPTPLPDFLMSPTVRKEDFSAEKTRRHNIFVSAEASWKDIQKRWVQETSDSKFKAKLIELHKIHQNLVVINEQFKAGKQKYEVKAKALQLKSHLGRHYIDQATISGIGPTRKATLASYGIETAADIERNSILAIPGFGDALTSELTKWRQSIEGKFTYDPGKMIILPEITKLANEYDTKRVALEAALLTGFEEFKQSKETINLNRQRLIREAENISLRYAQAKADNSLLQDQLEQLRKRKSKGFRTAIFYGVIGIGAIFLSLLAYITIFVPSTSGTQAVNTLTNGEQRTVLISPDQSLSLTPIFTTEQLSITKSVSSSNPISISLDYVTIEQAYEHMRNQAWQKYKESVTGSPVIWQGKVITITGNGDKILIDIGQKYNNDVVLTSRGAYDQFTHLKIGDVVVFKAIIEAISIDLEIKLKNVEFANGKSKNSNREKLAK